MKYADDFDGVRFWCVTLRFAELRAAPFVEPLAESGRDGGACQRDTP
jgi:hypothetical protein